MADMLATPADLASALQRDVDTASATLALEVTTAVVQVGAGGQRIVRATSTDEVLYGGPDRVLRLPQQPVISVASVSYGGVLLTQGTASGTWRLAKHGIWRDLGWAGYSWEGPVQVAVTYTHGYDPAGSDSDKQQLQLGRGFTLSLARGLFTNPDGTIREQIDDYSVAYAEASAALDASPSMRALLRKQYGPKARMVSVI
jgi:hypothetical protein